MDAPDGTEHSLAERLAACRQAHAVALPLKRDVATLTDGLLGVLFPQLSDSPDVTAEDIAARLRLLGRDLRRLLHAVVDEPRAEAVTRRFTDALPAVWERLRLDADAMVSGDPAAESLDEVVAAYPGFLAIAIHRLAHELHRLGVRIIPRLLSEIAHTRTGIDIHPGASIGASFCIDHGTGVVIGETAVIGDGVKVYQGVTLGAHSVLKAAAGTKRHPTIEDHVVLYANATVLGGDTVVGHHSVIGGNVWLTASVPPYSRVYHSSQVRVGQVADASDPVDFVI